jgi:hypothetical protein
MFVAVSTNQNQPARRLRWGGVLPLPPSGEVPYAKCRPELKGFSEAQITRWILDSDAWKDVMVPVLDQLEVERDRPGKEAPLYTSHSLESVLLYQRVCGLRSYKEARDRLASDRGAEARQLLGLTAPRNRLRMRKGRVVNLRDGIPSESTVSRHRTRFRERRRRQAYEQLFQRLVDEHLEMPELQEEARVLYVDGTRMLTHYTCPIVDPKTGRIVNDESITCFDGGYVPPDAGMEKWGHGYSLIPMVTASGLPLAYRVLPLHASEKNTAVELLGDYEKTVLPHLAPAGERPLTVLAADGAFHKPELREKARELGILENIHLASHGTKQESLDNVAVRNAERIPFDDANYKNWYANGHREVFCLCGKRATKRITTNSNGRVIARVEGKCPTCGSVTITSGEWRRAQNPTRFTRCNPSDPADRRDWLLGNPLTFNSPEGHEYGRRRFGHNEGFNGALVTRFGLVKGKRWFRRADQARTDVAMVFSIIHAIALYQREQVRQQAAANAPPGLAA